MKNHEKQKFYAKENRYIREENMPYKLGTKIRGELQLKSALKTDLWLSTMRSDTFSGVTGE